MSERKKLTIRDFMMTPEEIESYSEPSIMDEHTKVHDPEVWNKIVTARNLKFAAEMAPMIGSFGMGGGSPLGKFGKIRKHVSEAKSPLPQKIYDKAISHMDPEANWVDAGKVIAKPIEEESIGVIKHLVPEEQEIGKVIAKDMEPSWFQNVKKVTSSEAPESSIKRNLPKAERPLTLEERVDTATEKEKALFQRLLELTGRKPGK